MIPYKTNVRLSLFEFFSMVLLHVIYAWNQFGMEAAGYISLGFVPILLVMLVYRKVHDENAVIRIMYSLMIVTTYLMCLKLDTLAMLIVIFLVIGLMIALFMKPYLLTEYSIISIFVLVLAALFQMDKITLLVASQVYVIYLMLYCFAIVSMIFLISGADSYRTKMEEKNEEAREALNAKSNFLANMSHEIRTPMNAISGMADLLAEGEFSGQEEEYIGTIKKSSEKLLLIINEILDFSKIDSGKLEIIEDEYHFNSLIHDVISLIEFRLKDKRVKLITDIDPKVPRTLIGDESRIRQILINLLNNAVNFTHRGSITLKIEWEKVSDSVGRLQVSVIDTGIGISQENMKKLFTAFGQIDTKKNRNVEGTGLGLAISKNLANLMSGEIWAKSTLEKGSTFSFMLPQKIRDARPSNYDANHKNQDRVNDKFVVTFQAPHAKVLVVDDNRVNLQVACALMKKFGFDAIAIESGLEALERIEEKTVRYDMIFMDHMMPVMDGVEATKQIRAIDDDYAREIPIVALTANAIKGVEKQFKEAGMNDYLPKPIRMQQLSDILKKWLPLEKQFRVTGDQPAPGPEKEKKVIKVVGNDWSHDNYEKADTLGTLDGINVEEGIRNCGGDRGVYIQILHTFASSNLKAGLQAYYETKDMTNYGVMAHSIKGACRNIAAMDIAEIAYQMELAAKRKDWDFIQKKHEEFTASYTDIIKQIMKTMIPG